MPLSEFHFSMNCSWRFQAEIGGGFQAASQGRDKRSFTLSGIDIGEWDEAYFDAFSLSPSAYKVADLSSFRNLLGEDTNLRDVMTGFIITQPLDDDELQGLLVVKPNDANGFTGFWEGTTGNRVRSRGALALSATPEPGGTEGDAYPVAAGGNKIKFQNVGAHGIYVFVAIFGKSDQGTAT